MFCSISGEQCREPVVTPGGRIYDRRALENALQQTPGKDPISGEDLQIEDVISIKPGKESGPVAPRPPSSSSIPGMCVLFQNEWDALMLETFELKKQLDQTRQELAQALYQQDASCRVIARLIRERDEARSALTNVRLSGPEVGAVSGPTEITMEIKVSMENLSKRLMNDRKKRTAPSSLAKTDDISKYVELSSHPIHRASEPGILCVDIHPGKDFGDRIVTGGVDKQAVLFNKRTGKKVAALTGHTKKVTSVLFHHSQDVIFTASPDKTVRIWGSTAAGYETLNKIRTHSDAVSSIALHPSGDYLISSSLDETWGFHDVRSGNTLLKAKTGKPIHCSRFHADGILVGTATSDGLIQLWDVKDNVKNVAKIQAHKGDAKSISFSENGFYMGSCGADNTVKMWDLRKIAKKDSCELMSFKLPDSEVMPQKVIFDRSGIYLGCSGDHVRVFVAKTLKPIVTLSGHAGVSTDVKFGPDAKFLASTAMDRTLRFWGLDSSESMDV